MSKMFKTFTMMYTMLVISFFLILNISMVSSATTCTQCKHNFTSCVHHCPGSGTVGKRDEPNEYHNTKRDAHDDCLIACNHTYDKCKRDCILLAQIQIANI
ncbi:Hypothetical predicted protein [Mytilus galloprovincialis]|uniref:Uncharacterized protein n=1 Tax=Mytilus galloprovincialis TaxID=29158 RepID=A0A8B6DFG0_MYTGA|nr:Hypothetical predicted protein [Mytilus galloprovincialis]